MGLFTNITMATSKLGDGAPTIVVKYNAKKNLSGDVLNIIPKVW